MPSKPNFHASLQLPDQASVLAATAAGGKIPGPPAGGLIAEGDELMWVYVWIIQNGEMDEDTWSAAADGESPDGKTFKGKWEVETHMTDGSDPFREGTCALGTAMSLIKRKDGSKDVYWWTDAFELTQQPSSAT
jgi:hypothetical protein